MKFGIKYSASGRAAKEYVKYRNEKIEPVRKKMADSLQCLFFADLFYNGINDHVYAEWD